MKTLFTTIKDGCDAVTDHSIATRRFGQDRNAYSVLASVMAEVGELAEEVNIHQGYSYKRPGEDGIIGEAVDVMVSLIDLILLVDHTITEEQILDIARLKCAKWLMKVQHD